MSSPVFAKKDSRLSSGLDWSHVLLFICVFSLLALWPLSTPLRPALLSAGACAALLLTGLAVWRNCTEERMLLAFMSFVLVYWLFAFPPAINGPDDNSAYLIFASDFLESVEKTAQPLSERRLFSVGGLYALQAPTIHWLGIKHLSLVEPVFGLALYFLIITSRIPPITAGCYLLIVLLSLAPLLASKVLANTSSVFVLSVFTFALLELGKSLLEKPSLTWTQASLLVALPLVAATYRPTTFPFNALLASLLVLALLKRKEATKLIIAGAIGLPALYLALAPYHEFGGTYLYPILGRGFHITSEGFSISASISPAAHAANIFAGVLTDPFFAPVGILVAWQLRESGREQSNRFLLRVYAAYLASYVLIIVTTGGLATARYTFPVSLAMIASLGLSRLTPALASIGASRPRMTNILKQACVLGTVACLTAIRVLHGPAVVEKRLRMHEVSADIRESIDAIQSSVRSRGGATLIVDNVFGRFVVDGLDQKYFVMDQPGMLSPWKSRSASYEDGLREFVARNDIRSIVLPAQACMRELDDTHLISGWTGLMEFARQRNERAICALLENFDTKVVGQFSVSLAR